MTSFLRFREWVEDLDLKAYAGAALGVVCVIAMVVFGILPSSGLLMVNAFLSGTVWGLCIVILLAGGKRLDAALTCAVALIAGGLTTSVPSIFYEHTPVDWGSTLSRFGLLILFGWVINSIFKKWKGEAVL